MRFTGNLDGLVVDYATNRQKITIQVNEDARKVFENLKDTKVSVDIEKYRKKRSLDANAYYWKVLTILAEKLEVSKPFMHNYMLRKYGQLEYFDGKLAYTMLPDTPETEKKVDEMQEAHFSPTAKVLPGKDGINYRSYVLLRGSHSYDTNEMSKLIDGLLTEAKDAGITDAEIMTPDERRLLKEKYNVDM